MGLELISLKLIRIEVTSKLLLKSSLMGTGLSSTNHKKVITQTLMNYGVMLMKIQPLIGNWAVSDICSLVLGLAH